MVLTNRWDISLKPQQARTQETEHCPHPYHECYGLHSAPSLFAPEFLCSSSADKVLTR